MRERIYTIVSKAEDGDIISSIYDGFIMFVAVLSIVPMMYREEVPAIHDYLIVPIIYILFFDYILRWITHDFKSKEKGWKAFLLYPFTPLAIMDLMGLLPTIGLLPRSFMILRLFRLGKLLQYSQSGRIIIGVFKNQKKTLLSVLTIAIAYIFVTALIMFAYEPADNFPSFFHALYWSTTALTTVGYGDIYPCTHIGRLISMCSSLFGVAVIAMPAGVVTAGFMDELGKAEEEKKQKLLEKTTKVPENEDNTPGTKRRVINITPKVKRYLVFMIIGVALNIRFYEIGHVLHLPAWIDNIGTALIAVVLEPAAGLVVAFATNFFQSAFIYNIDSIVYYLNGAAVAVCFGVVAAKSGKINIKQII
ncbi:MAG: ion transporter, partial [Clostridia bacterium]|nr:ion transporter [Clostridia bacterium]